MIWRSKKNSLSPKTKGRGGTGGREEQPGICYNLAQNSEASPARLKTCNICAETLSCLGGTCYNEPLYFWYPSWWRSDAEKIHRGSRTRASTKKSCSLTGQTSLHQPRNPVHVQPSNLFPALTWLKNDAGAIHQVLPPCSQKDKTSAWRYHWSQKTHSHLSSGGTWPSQPQPLKPLGLQNNAPVLCHRRLKNRGWYIQDYQLRCCLFLTTVITKPHLKKVRNERIFSLTARFPYPCLVILLHAESQSSRGFL